MWCLVVFQHDCMPSIFPKVKKSYPWETSSVSKKDVVYLRLHFTETEHYGGITKRMNFNNPVVETSESIEPNDTNLEVNAIGYTISSLKWYSSLKCSKQKKLQKVNV